MFRIVEYRGLNEIDMEWKWMKWIEYFLEFASPQLTWQTLSEAPIQKGWAACPSLRHQIEYQSRFDFPGRLLQASGHGDVVGGWSGGSGRTPMFVDGRGERIGTYAQNLEAVGKPGQCKGQIVKRHLDEHGTYAAGICRGGGDGNFDLFDFICVLVL